MYKIVSFRYESVIQKKIERLRRANFILPPPPPITNPFLRPCVMSAIGVQNGTINANIPTSDIGLSLKHLKPNRE